MKDNQQAIQACHSGKISTAVFRNAIPAMAAMLMVLVYNLADTFFIGQTHDDLQVAADARERQSFSLLSFACTGGIWYTIQKCNKLKKDVC